MVPYVMRMYNSLILVGLIEIINADNDLNKQIPVESVAEQVGFMSLFIVIEEERTCTLEEHG